MSNDDWFGMLPKRVGLNPTLSNSAMRVYVVLAIHADRDTGQCFVSNRRISESTGMSRATIKRAFSDLIESGFVKREYRFREGSQAANLYILDDIAKRRKKGEGGSASEPAG